MNWFVDPKKMRLPSSNEVLPGRAQEMPVPARHAILDAPIRPPYPAGTEIAEFGMGCFWGAEKLFWNTPGVVTTAVGYSGGGTPNPTYEEVCTGRTGHIETVRVVFDPKKVTYGELLKIFWEEHDPTQGMRQGGDQGTQYRSAILTHNGAQQREAEAAREAFQTRLKAAGMGTITTDIRPAPELYFAEAYHQQYLEKNPNGYCPNHATGVTLPADFFKSAGAARRAVDAAKAIEQAR
ncbi:MAG: peptide-methionine (S)-S-oxide reductase MsrA [Candidatus Limnocylindrales bacterium]|jgi:peptide-methionine (S)-S-oxide reductase